MIVPAKRTAYRSEMSGKRREMTVVGATAAGDEKVARRILGGVGRGDGLVGGDAVAVGAGEGGSGHTEKQSRVKISLIAVSYTHLTLPTICSV